MTSHALLCLLRVRPLPPARCMPTARAAVSTTGENNGDARAAIVFLRCNACVTRLLLLARWNATHPVLLQIVCAASVTAPTARRSRSTGIVYGNDTTSKVLSQTRPTQHAQGV